MVQKKRKEIVVINVLQFMHFSRLHLMDDAAIAFLHLLSNHFFALKVFQKFHVSRGHGLFLISGVNGTWHSKKYNRGFCFVKMLQIK